MPAMSRMRSWRAAHHPIPATHSFLIQHAPPGLNSIWAAFSSLITAHSSIITPANPRLNPNLAHSSSFTSTNSNIVTPPVCSARPNHRYVVGIAYPGNRPNLVNNRSYDGCNSGTQQARYFSNPSARTSDESKQETMTTKSDYWGISFSHPIHREDGSPWPWRSFKPTDAYTPDTTIDLNKHFKANKWVDKVALWTVERLRWLVDIFFKDRHVSHALLLETVAGVPGMVAGMSLHLKSLRSFEHSGGWIKALLEEAENERMHLMTWMEVSKPNMWERALVISVQGVFFSGYTFLYVLSPRMAHRFTGYLEEEAVVSYTNFLHAIDTKQMPNDPAPLIAIDYWRLPHDATIRDVVIVIRADEAHHRDVNHYAANLYAEHRKLNQYPAPLDYH